MTTGAVLRRGRQLLAGHQEAAVAGEGDHGALGVDQLGRDRRRRAIAHRAAGRAELRAEAAILVVAVDPDAVIAGAVGDDRVRGQVLAQPDHDLAELQGAGRRRGAGGSRDTARARLRSAARQALLSTGSSARGAAAKARTPAWIAEVGRVDQAQLLGAGMDVDQGLPRLGHVDQRVAAARRLAQPRADQQQEVGVAHPLAERRARPRCRHGRHSSDGVLSK